jgi:hypothetical protein
MEKYCSFQFIIFHLDFFLLFRSKLKINSEDNQDGARELL